MNLIPWRNKRRDGETSLIERPAARLHEQMDRLFERFVRNPLTAGSDLTSEEDLMLGPRIDLAESDSDITITAELPGLEPKDVEISVTGNMMTIRGEKKQEKKQKDRNYYYVERQFGSFQRSIRLPSSVDPDKIEAVARNGTLTITLAKQPGSQPKRIPVKTD
jgi:HSP20 family protein